jgi:hypothetical protein
MVTTTTGFYHGDLDEYAPDWIDYVEENDRKGLEEYISANLFKDVKKPSVRKKLIKDITNGLMKGITDFNRYTEFDRKTINEAIEHKRVQDFSRRGTDGKMIHLVTTKTSEDLETFEKVNWGKTKDITKEFKHVKQTIRYYVDENNRIVTRKVIKTEKLKKSKVE